MDNVTAGLVVILGLGGDIAWVLKVGGILTLFQVFIFLGDRWVNTISHPDLVFLVLLLLVDSCFVGNRRWRGKSGVIILSMRHINRNNAHQHAEQNGFHCRFNIS